MNFKSFALLTALPLMLPAAVQAAGGTKTGTYRGMSYTAQSTIIGQTSTATIAGGGNPIYFGTAAKYRGTVGLLMDYGAGGRFVCSGSLSANRTSIITAGHCVSDGFGTKGPNSVTAYFYNPAAPDANETSVYAVGAPNVTAVAISNIIVNPLYTGEVIDQNDIAVLKLAGPAPAFATGYDLYIDDLTGEDFNVAGYGRRSSSGGANGVTAPFGLGVGRLRQGDNRYDFAFGDADFGGAFTDRDANGKNVFGFADVEFSFVSDFDNGLAANDASCRMASNFFNLSGPKFCDTGRGAREVGIAGGDSGGPGFINGKLASVNSYGLIFSTDPSFGDFGGGLNSGFGEFNGYAPIFASAAFVQGAVPEPATWALMIGGFGMVGAAARRRRRAALTV